MRLGNDSNERLILSKDDVEKLCEYFRTVVVIPHVNDEVHADFMLKFWNSLSLISSDDRSAEPVLAKSMWYNKEKV